MSNFLVPSSVVARRKTNHPSRSRPVSRGSDQSDPSPGVSPHVAAPPGFPVPAGTPPIPSFSIQDWQYAPPPAASGFLLGLSVSQPTTPPASAEQSDEDLIAFANTSIGFAVSAANSTTSNSSTTTSSSPPPSCTTDHEFTELVASTKEFEDRMAGDTFSDTGPATNTESHPTPAKPTRNYDHNDDVQELGDEAIGEWDQFQANRELFDIPGEFDENCYTTQLDKSQMDPVLLSEAEQLAIEIEKGPVKNLVTTLAKNNLEGSPFHLALISNLQKSPNGGMSLTEVMSMLSEFSPDLNHFFANIQSQYDVLPAELLGALSDIQVQTGDGEEEEEEWLYWTPLVPSDCPQSTNHTAAAGEPIATTIIAGASDTQVAAGETTEGEEEVLDCWENMLSDDEEEGDNNGKDNCLLPTHTVDIVIAPSSSSNEEIIEGNAAPINLGSSSPTMEGPSSSSTSPTTVTTASSADMDELRSMTVDVGQLQRSKPKAPADEALTAVGDLEQEKQVASLEACQETSKEITQQEDRNDGDDNHFKGADRSEDKSRDRDDNDANHCDAVTAPAQVVDVAPPTTPKVNGSLEQDRKRLAPVSIVATPKSRRSEIPPGTQPTQEERKTPFPGGINPSIEAMAALEFLTILHEEIEDGTNEWPEDQLQLKMFLTKITNCCFSKNADGITREQLPRVFRSWFEQLAKRDKKDSKRLNKVRNEATSQLLDQLEAMECVENTSLLLWRKRRIETLVDEFRQKDWRASNNKKSSSLGKNENKPDAGKKKVTNLWQNPRKIEALVNGYQHNKKPGTLSAKNQKSCLGLVVLKKQRGRSSGKTILSSPLPSTPKNQHNGTTKSTSAWKAAAPGPIKQSQATDTAPKGRAACQPLARSTPDAVRPLAVPIKAPSSSSSQSDKRSLPSTSEARQQTDSASQESGFTTPPSSSQPSLSQGLGTSDASSLSSWQTGSGQVRPQGAFQHVKQATATHWNNSTLNGAGLELPNFDAPKPHIPTPSPRALETHDQLLAPSPLEYTNDVAALLELLPGDIAAEFSDPTLQHQLTDIILDKGRRPVVWISGTRQLIGADDRIVTSEDLDFIIDRVGGFGDSNRVGLDEQLHSLSAIRNRKNDIIGLSMRVGRHITGIADMISDLLFDDPSKSILFLGEPGSGKTTILREVTRLLAKESEVMIVDTVNEIAGDGDVPHPCVGQARRMMVPTLLEQGSIMEECIQNHSPNVVVVDKLGHPDEVEVARTCKDQDVRLIASMSGNLRKIVKNGKLQGLLGVESAGLRPGSKSMVKRTGSPVFDVVVELCPGTHHEWNVVLNTADAVDKILGGEKYQCQHRIRNSNTGSFSTMMVDV